jgi:hypothetical protein
VTSAHFIYIPMVFVVGLVVGIFLGGRAARDAYQLERRREEERAARKAARAARDKEPPPEAS